MSIPGSATPLLLATTAAGAAAAYQINRSLRFNRADDAHLSRTISTKYTTFTTSCWVKRASFNTWQYIWAQYDGSAYRGITFGQGNDKLSLYDGNHVYTTAVFRDPAAWYHIVLKCSSGAATLYVNNTQVSTTTNFFIGGGSFRIGDFITGGNELDGYIADFHAVLGTAHDPTDFAEYDDNNNWNPKEFSGNFGSDGFHLDLSDNSSNAALGHDAAVTAPTLNPKGGMDVVTYAGNSGTQTISGLAFQPDFVWIKARNHAVNHILSDSIRGTSKELNSNTNGAENDQSGYGLTAFSPNGFSVKDTNGGYGVNGNYNYVAWAWKAGGTASPNTNGDITTQVSVNSAYGFSISTWTSPSSADTNGWTLGHGLPSAPKFMLVKNRSSAGNWTVFHTSLGNTKALYLNNSGTGQTNQSLWNNTDPTSTVWSAGSTGWYGQSNNFVVYAWSEVSKFSKFGSYTGNGSSTGPTVTTGFKPRYVLIKRTDSAGNWGIYDTERGGFTDNNKTLLADTSGSESTDNNKISITSTGFSPASGFANVNANGGTYIYAAFADRPGNNFDVNNLVATAGVDGAAGFDAVTWSGNGGTQSISNLKFQPDLVWIKRRDGSAWHFLFDSTRGANKALFSNDASAESNYGSGYLDSFNSNGFTLGSNADINGSSRTFVGWAWNAGANSNKTYTVKVVSDSGNKYRFDDFGTSAVTLDLQEGSTYIFDQSDSSNAGHPIRFGTSANGTNYTTGVTHTGTPGSAGAKTTIVIPAAVTYSAGTQSNADTGRPLANLFDNSTSTLIAAASGNNSSNKITLPVSVTAQTSVRVYAKAGGYDNGPITLSNNGTTVSTIAAESSQASGYKSFTGTFPMTFNELTVNRSSGGLGSGAALIEVDGQILVDSSDSTPTLYYSCANHTGMGGQINTNSTAGASNFDGSIQAVAKADNTYGFSIASYTGNGTSGATIGHGLSSAPKWIMVKRRNSSAFWEVFHTSVGNTKVLYLNNTDAQTSSSASWNNTSPTSSVFSVGNSSGTNASGSTYIAYCWSEISGFSKFGSYAGDGGTKTITTGFKPAFILSKSYDTGSNWHLLDSERGSAWLEANGDAAENSNSNIVVTYLDNGFTVNGSNINNSGTNYVYMAFADTPDSSVIDSLIDTPTNYDAASGNNGGNYATLNPLQSGATLANGNLDATSGQNKAVFATIAVGETGKKFYWEATINDSHFQQIGIADMAVGKTSTAPGDSGSEGYIYLANGEIYHDGATTSTGNSTFTTGDIIGVKYDDTTRSLSWNKNGGSFFGAVTVDDGRHYAPVFGAGGGSDEISVSVNFGQRPFAISSVPTGYKSLCTQNLPDPTIADGSTAFDTKLWTVPSGGANTTVSGLKFAPDWVLTKNRSQAYEGSVYDTVRGDDKYLKLFSSSGNAAEATAATRINLTSDGFVLEADNDNANYTAGSASVGWAWDAGSSTVSNTDGSITSSVRASQTNGFSIATYTGNGTNNSTIGHGLNAAPSLIMIKNRSNAYGWAVLHTSVGTTGTTLDGAPEYYMLQLDSTYSRTDFTNDNIWNPTNSTFKINGAGTSNWTNASGDNYVAYCFAPVAGYSAFGSFVSLNSTDNVFVYTGFQPRWILWKRSSSSGGWFIYDAARNTSNPVSSYLEVNSSGAESDASPAPLDFVSNGFKVRNTLGGTGTFIYACFASHPFRTAKAR